MRQNIYLLLILVFILGFLYIIGLGVMSFIQIFQIHIDELIRAYENVN